MIKLFFVVANYGFIYFIWPCFGWFFLWSRLAYKISQEFLTTSLDITYKTYLTGWLLSSCLSCQHLCLVLSLCVHALLLAVVCDAQARTRTHTHTHTHIHTHKQTNKHLSHLLFACLLTLFAYLATARAVRRLFCMFLFLLFFNLCDLAFKSGHLSFELLDPGFNWSKACLPPAVCLWPACQNTENMLHAVNPSFIIHNHNSSAGAMLPVETRMYIFLTLCTLCISSSVSLSLCSYLSVSVSLSHVHINTQIYACTCTCMHPPPPPNTHTQSHMHTHTHAHSFSMKKTKQKTISKPVITIRKQNSTYATVVQKQISW